MIINQDQPIKMKNTWGKILIGDVAMRIYLKSFSKVVFLMVLICLFFLPSISSSQDIIEEEFEVVENVSSPSEEDDVEVGDIMNAFLESKGWEDGPNKNSKTGREFFIALGEQEILAPYNSKSFITSRQNAYTMAMARAKRSMVEHLGVDIETSMIMEMKEPSEKREEARLAAIKSDVTAIEEKMKASKGFKSDLQKKGEEWDSEFVKALGSGADRMYREKLDNQLKEKGIDPNQPVDAQLLKKEFSQTFQEATKALAQSRVSGVQAYTTFEHLPKEKKKGSIGVIAIWSEKLHAMSLSIAKGKSLVPPGIPNLPIKQQIPKDKKSLLMTFGVQLKTDENGMLNLVSFCQEGQRNKRAKVTAQRQARLCAQKQIKQYAGESLYSSSTKENAESLEAFEGDMEIYENDSSFEDTIKTVSEKMKISGISTLHNWHTKHPVTKQVIRGVVVSWSPDSAAVVQSFGSDSINAPEAAPTFKKVEKKSPVEKKQEPRRSLSGRGATASDDF